MQSIAEEVRNESDINLNVRLLAFVPMVTSLSGSVRCKSGPPPVVSSAAWPHFNHLPSVCQSVHFTHKQQHAETVEINMLHLAKGAEVFCHPPLQSEDAQIPEQLLRVSMTTGIKPTCDISEHRWTRLEHVQKTRHMTKNPWMHRRRIQALGFPRSKEEGAENPNCSRVGFGLQSSQKPANSELVQSAESGTGLQSLSSLH